MEEIMCRCEGDVHGDEQSILCQEKRERKK